MDPVTEIICLHGRYCWLVDHGDWDGWAKCFADDGAFVARGQRHEGREAIVKYVQGELERFSVIRHLAHVPWIEVESEISARARSYFELRAGTVRGADTHGLGSYEDRLVCRDGQWMFAERVAEFDYWVKRGEPWFQRA
jgi:hypothetical protein